MKSVTINGIEFNSDAAAERHAKEILNTGDIGSLNDVEFEFMIAYFEYMHHEWTQKKGTGVKSINRVVSRQNRSNREFKLYRIDGTHTDISCDKKWKKEHPTKDFYQALRDIIEPQINAFREKEFNSSDFLTCPITGQMITRQTCDIDHYYPTFDELAKQFINENNITDFKTLVVGTKDNDTGRRLTDKVLEHKFFEFHKKNARLRVLSKNANRSAAKIKRPKPQQQKTTTDSDIMKTCFTGITGKLYVKNPVDTGRYCYAVYGSANDYTNMAYLPVYVSADTALDDYKEEIKLPEVISKY